jgi:hypothetical protein
MKKRKRGGLTEKQLTAALKIVTDGRRVLLESGLSAEAIYEIEALMMEKDTAHYEVALACWKALQALDEGKSK